MATVDRGTAITAVELDALLVLANRKLAPVTAYAFGTANWLTQMNRMRGDLWKRYMGGIGDNPPLPVAYGYTKVLRGVLEAGVPPGFSLARLRTVSGPWVVRTIGATGGVLDPDGEWDWSDVEFWYASGLTPNFQRSTGFFTPSGPGITTILANELDNAVSVPDSGGAFYNPSIKSYIRIGGTESGVLTANVTGGGALNGRGILIAALQWSGTPTSDSGLSVTTDIPGVTISYASRFALVNLPTGEIPPGLYTLEATCASNFVFYPPEGGRFSANGLKFTWPTLVSGASVEAIQESGAVLSVKGHASADTESGGWPYGIYVTQDSGGGFEFTYIDVVTGERFTVGPSETIPLVSVNVSTNLWTVSCGGLFVAKTIPVDRENTEIDLFVPYEAMRGTAPHADTATVRTVTPAVSYRVGRYPCTKDADDPPGWTIAKGMCVYAVTVRRLSERVNGIDVQPALKPEMRVDIGYYVSGSMHILDTVVIAADQMDATIYPFWPIFGTVPMRYAVQGDPTADAIVQVYANYQPPYMGPENSLNPNATYPIAACLYNDLWNALSNLPDP